MFSRKIKIRKILLFLLAFWFLISTTRTFYNLSKLYTEERNWYGLTNEQKRGKFFGDTHYFLRFLDSHTINKSRILLFTNDLRTHYLGRYYLYPAKEIIGEHDKFLWYPEKDIYEYIAIYPVNSALITQAKNSSNIAKFKKVSTYKGKEGQIGILYKK